MKILRKHSDLSIRSAGAQGFTLLEIMISVTILAIVGGGIFATVNYSKRMSSAAQEKMLAISLIDKKLSELKANGPATLPECCIAADATCTSPDTNKKCRESIDVMFKNCDTTNPDDCYMETIVKKETGSTDDRLKEVKVSVYWKDVFGNDKSESVATVLYA